MTRPARLAVSAVLAVPLAGAALAQVYIEQPDNPVFAAPTQTGGDGAQVRIEQIDPGRRRIVAGTPLSPDEVQAPSTPSTVQISIPGQLPFPLWRVSAALESDPQRSIFPFVLQAVKLDDDDDNGDKD